MVEVASLGSIRDLPGLYRDEIEEVDDSPNVASLVVRLRSTDEDERDHALSALAEVVDSAYGEDGQLVGQEMRANGGVPILAWLLAEPFPDVQQMSLMILGNLCSDSVDANSRETKQLLLQCGGARALLSCVYTDDPAILLFACGALQNLCFEREWAEIVVSHDVQRRLEALLEHEDALIVRYASGALQNLLRSLQLENLSTVAMEAVKERTLEHRREEWLQQRAVQRIAAAVRAIPAAQRLQWFERGHRRRQRLANVDPADRTETWSWATSDWSRPSSAASSRSAASSYLSAHSLHSHQTRVHSY